MSHYVINYCVTCTGTWAIEYGPSRCSRYRNLNGLVTDFRIYVVRPQSPHAVFITIAKTVFCLAIKTWLTKLQQSPLLSAVVVINYFVDIARDFGQSLLSTDTRTSFIITCRKSGSNHKIALQLAHSL